MKRTIRLVLTGAVLAAAGWSHAALYQWDFSGIPSIGTGGYGDEGYQGTSTIGVTSDGLWRGGDETARAKMRKGVNKGGAWGGRYFEDANAVDAIAHDTCFYFNLIVPAGYSMTLESLQTAWYTSPKESPTTALWQYRIASDGINYGEWAPLGNENDLPHTMEWDNELGTDVRVGGVYDWVSLDLTSISAITGIIEFRLVIWGGGGSSGHGGNGRFYFGTGNASLQPGSANIGMGWGNTMTVNGALAVVPEPSSVALLSLSCAALLLRRRKQH